MLFTLLAISILIALIFSLLQGGINKVSADPDEEVGSENRELRSVYFVKKRSRGNQVKIGYSARNPHQRVVELERINRTSLMLVAEIRCNYAWDVEQRIHQVFRDQRLLRSLHLNPQWGNEWYSVEFNRHASVILAMERITTGLSKLPNFKMELIVHDRRTQSYVSRARATLAEIEKNHADGSVFIFEMRPNSSQR